MWEETKEMKAAYAKQKTHRLKSLCRILVLISACTVLSGGCGKDRDSGQEIKQEPDEPKETGREQVQLTVWGAQEDTQLMEQIIQDFKNEYQEQAELQITYRAQGESSCKDVLLGGLEEGAWMQSIHGQHRQGRSWPGYMYCLL